MSEVEDLRERLRVAAEALSQIAADSDEARGAWICDGCDGGDAISHAGDIAERARSALVAMSGAVTPTLTIVKIGSISSYQCYLNLPIAEALARFEKDTGSAFDPSYQWIETLTATDRLEAYDLSVPTTDANKEKAS